jgi:hypothetical protein
MASEWRNMKDTRLIVLALYVEADNIATSGQLIVTGFKDKREREEKSGGL